ncbi:hypothetical protein BD289DRAFT_433537 [Coniella lustricola]|uniref:Uncharacterized protein n=1 Tax=Coniella lustricola TaxID=2025994 RepID=A0A2T3A8H4_9PEZI|nr:hypothetical protein BD289DRAFT_433537 [Coniella lustricola]
MLYDNPEINDSSHSLNHFLDDVPESCASADDLSTKKRQRAMTVKDDIMHLPQPLKKQKSTQNISQNIMPPIINGLYEPPPNAAVFPPIALDDGNNEGVAPSTLHTLNQLSTSSSTVILTSSLDAPDSAPEMHVQSEGRHDSISTAPDGERPLAKVKRKAAKPRKKWSEEETKHLLLGVSKYGVGKWTSILDDPEYSFNGRTAGDLKDRFRTCCPDELRIGPSKSRESLRSQDKHSSQSPVEPRPKGKSKTALLLEDILADPDDLVAYHNYRDDFVSVGSSSQSAMGQPESDPTAKPKKSRAHRKKIEDLQAMGIHGPFKKSHRRERRPFTQQDDDQILEGLQMYGPAWTKIQRDSRFDLSSRQPTDLRDRVRNKYPDMYKQIEEKQGHGKESLVTGTSLPTRPAPSARSNSIMEPSVNNMINENSLMTLEPHLHRAGSREELMMPKWAASMPPAPGSGGASHGGSFHELPGMDSLSRDPLEAEVGEGGEPSSSGAFSGMMDISRLLLDG